MAVFKHLVENLRSYAILESDRLEHPPTFSKELNYQCGRILFYGSLLTTFVWLPYIPLDMKLHPEEPLLPALRVGLSVISAIIFILYISRRFLEHNLLFLNIIGAYLAISCGLITALSKADPVYIGGNLFILTVIAVVPVRRRAAFIIFAASLLTLFGVGYLKGVSFESNSAHYNLYDLVSVTIVAILFIYLLDSNRYMSWVKSRKIEEQSRELKSDKEKIDKLLHNILPAAVARELKDKGSVKPVFFESATIVFTDFVDFTHITEKLTPEQLVSELDEVFSEFDRVMDKYGLEKLKTIGDSYMFAGGVPVPSRTHAIDAVLAALEIRNLLATLNKKEEKSLRPRLEIRIGINTGSLMAGVVGEKKFIYDVWGDAVTVASRLESSGEKGRINISESTRREIKDFFITEARGQILAKNKGVMSMHFVERIKPELSADATGLVPGKSFIKKYQAVKERP